MNSPATPARIEQQIGTRQLVAIAAALVAVWAAVYLPWLGMLDLLLEEPRRALIARTMMESGDYLVPRLGGEIYTAKPPLFNGLISLSAAIGGGLNELTARMPSAIAVALLAVVFVFTARPFLAMPGLVFLGLALMLSPEFIAKGSLAEIETVFTLLVALSIWSWYLLDRMAQRGWRLWLLPVLLMAFAYLAKREPAVVFFYLSIAPFLLVHGRWKALFAPGHVAAGLVAVMLVGGWLVSVVLQTGWEVLWDTLQREVLQRGTEQSWQSVIRHVLLYPLELLVAMLPFSLLLPLLVDRRLRAALRNRYGDLLLFCGLAVIANLPVYWFRGEVSVRYFMPMFPFALLVAAMIFEVLWVEPESVGRRSSLYLKGLLWGGLGVAAMLLLMFTASIAVPLFSAERQTLIRPLFAVALVILTGVVAGLGYRRIARSSGVALLGSFVLVVLLARAFYFNFLLPDKLFRVERERNAPAIVEKVEQITRGATVLVHSVPWAIWYYAPTSLLQSFPGVATLEQEPWLLVSERVVSSDAFAPLNVSEAASFHYKGEKLLLLRAKPRVSTTAQ